MLLPSKRRSNEEEQGGLTLTSLMDTFTVIVMFLIKQFGTTAVNVAGGYLPPTANTRLPVQHIMSLQVKEIARDAILYRIASKDEKSERKDAKNGYQQLRADLRSEKSLVDAALTEEELKGAIDIVCDKRMSYSTLLGVMTSAAGAGFFKLKLIAQP